MSTKVDQRVGYVVNAFPVVSETFLVNEIRAVEREGVPVAILTLDRREDPIVPEGADAIRAELIRPPNPLPWGWLRYLEAHLLVAVRRLPAYLRLTRDDLLLPLVRTLLSSGGGRGIRVLRKRWRLFGLAPLVAIRARRAGVGHFHAHYAKAPLEIAARASWLTGIPYSFAVHAKDLYTTPKDRLSRRLAKAKFAITCHPHGNRTLRSLAASHRDRAKIHLIPHGLDLTVFSPDGSPREPGLVVAVGRLTPKKGFDVLIEACARLRNKVAIRCVIFGDGRLRNHLRRLVRKNRLADMVSLQGFESQRELAKWYRRAQVVAVPARVLTDGNRDGIPNVMLEAMACGAPVVATPVGSIGEFLEDGVTGHLVPPDDPRTLAIALKRCIGAPEKAGRMADRALALVQPLDFRKSGKKIAKLFRRRLPSTAPRRPFIPTMKDAEIDRQVRAAARRLGRLPKLQPDLELAIARSVAPGLRENAWRSDFDRLVARRLWDEVAKAPRAADLSRFARARGVTLSPSSRVLDLGCGRGGVSVALKARGIPVVSLDLRVRNCRSARLRAQRYDLDLPAVGARAEVLPFRDSSFDLVCLFEVLEHVEDPVGLLREARRVCRPEGLSVVTVVNRWAHLDPHYRLWGINFLPRPVAAALIATLGRSKRSWNDNQALADMHYFSFPGFVRFANRFGFEVHDPERPERGIARLWHLVGRGLSLGYNTVTLVLEPTRAGTRC